MRESPIPQAHSPLRLTDEQCHYLRILGCNLKPVVDIGAGGITNSLLKQLDRAFADYELVKVRIPFGDRGRRHKVVEELAPRSAAVVVLQSGYEALLYRRASNPIIHFPSKSI